MNRLLIMARLTKAQWQEIKIAYEVDKLTFSELAEQFGVNKSNVSRKAKKEEWNQQETQQLIDASVRNRKETALLRKKTQLLNATEQRAINLKVEHQLEMEEIYNSFEKQLMGKAAKFMNTIDEADQYAGGKIVQMSNVYKNMKGKGDINIQNNNSNNSQVNNDNRVAQINDMNEDELLNELQATEKRLGLTTGE